MSNNKSQFQIYINEKESKSFECTHNGSSADFLNHLKKLKDEVNLGLTEIIEAEKKKQISDKIQTNDEKSTENDDEDLVLDGILNIFSISNIK